jgi:hypothetical protein
VSELTKALVQASFSLLHPRMLLMMLWPVLVALALWLALAFAFWPQAAAWLQLQLNQSAPIAWAIGVWPLSVVAAHLAGVLLVLLFIPLVLITVVLIIGVYVMPAMVGLVAERSFPGLARMQGGTFTGSLLNGVMALAWFVLLLLLS